MVNPSNQSIQQLDLTDQRKPQGLFYVQNATEFLISSFFPRGLSFLPVLYMSPLSLLLARTASQLRPVGPYRGTDPWSDCFIC